MMKNKKAWIRIVEAVIGIMIIFGGILFILAKQPVKIDISEEVYEKQRQILEAIANNESMRNEIINGETESTSNFISKNIPSSWNFTISICKTDEICTSTDTPNDRDIYVSETVVSASLTDYPEKKSNKLVFFIWGR